ncbi:Precorrin-6A reductase [Rhodobacteraceae bacterium THAF1]|uniref:precorrin-6A/cobalt-precorrin-6A reductase n=1 Tax=Palleronia sp. THAF1 TaxID=2587842 RepID=UPI000F3FD44C|nr:precorrin-6A/cobalt-precorrin-6A reductase [Palleronia sp. THAF1]QFU09198.1 Precorrin-6A reductase [Palleronia sp. THAF1]VDC27306.1 Precorrin-6A reductase [Rhodobacteraceae bacterium THAF1]
MTRLLLLAGTREARHVVTALSSLRGLSVVVSVAAPERAPQPYGTVTRIGGFGGDEGFAAYLRRERIAMVIDATHPFAAGISHRSARVCAEVGVDYAQLLRPAWRPVEGDTWHFAQDEAAAAAMIPEGATVLIATGRERLSDFGAMEGRRVFVRQLDKAPAVPTPFADGHWLVETPPLSVESEVARFTGVGLDWLVVRNAGGASSRAKLDAARELGVEVAMIRRPQQPEATRFDTVAGAVAWARRRM